MRLRMYALVAILSLGIGSAAQAETIELTRTDNGNEQTGETQGYALETGDEDPYFDRDYGPNDYDAEDLSASATTDLDAVVNFNIATGSVTASADCNTAPSGSTYGASVSSEATGPAIITGDEDTGYLLMSGTANSTADFVVGSPTDPYAVLVMTGTITISFSPSGSSADETVTVQVGGSHITCTPDGCTGVIKDLSAPGGQYTVSTPALGGTWYVSEHTTPSSSIHLSSSSSFSLDATDLISEYPDFSGSGSCAVNTQ